MMKLLFGCSLLSFLVAPMAQGQLASTLFINHVDQPITAQYTQYGEASLVLDASAGSIMKVAGYRRVSVLLGSTHATSAVLTLGKISNATMSQWFTLPLDQKIHTYDIVGPEMSIILKGAPPNTTEPIKIWVYLTT